jgi:hypothetical protein
MSELDELERDLEEAANVWFSPALHEKLKRVVAIARTGQVSLKAVNARIEVLERRVQAQMLHAGPIELTGADE